MATTTFDTLEYFEKLKSAGFTEPQARVQVEAMRGVVRSYDEATRKKLATKGEIKDVRLELKEEISETRHEILEWMVTAIIAQTALLVGVIK